MRIDPHQKWHPVYLLQPVYNLLLMPLFEWGVALARPRLRRDPRRREDRRSCSSELKGIAGKARAQIVKDYVALPAAQRPGDDRDRVGGCSRWPGGREAGRRSPGAEARRVARRLRRSRRSRGRACCGQLIERKSFREPFRRTLTADVAANIVRNVWSYAIIFCGHFPDQTYTFSQEETEDETRGGWYVRQLARRRQHRGRPAVPRHQRQPRLPGRAPPLPGHAQHALRRDRPEGPRDLRALRAALQHRARSSSSSAWSSARSCGSPSPAAKRGRSPGRTDGPRLRGSGEGAPEDVRAAA